MADHNQPLETGSDQLVAESVDGVVTITFNRPERHNALSQEMMRALASVVDTCNAEPEVRVVVLRGAGERAFISGADIGELDGDSADPGDTPSDGNRPLALLGLRKPAIAAIGGYCIGGGLMTAMFTDIRIATRSSTFGVPAAQLGVGYPADATRMLVALVGAGAASDILLTGRRFGAEEALTMGLIHRVVEPDQLHTTVIELAVELAANAPLSLQAGKASVRAAIGLGDGDEAQAAIRRAWASSDFIEGRAAFAERRSPTFRGR